MNARTLLSRIGGCALSLVVANGCGHSAANPYNFERYSDPGSAFVLVKPRTWVVRQSGDQSSLFVTVNDPSGMSTVEFYFAPNNARISDSIRLASQMTQNLKRQFPDLSASDVYASADRSRSVATFSYTRGGRAMQGRYYFSAAAGFVSITGYCAPASELIRQRPMLLDIMGNLQFPKGQPGGSVAAPRPAVAQPISVPLVRRQAPDGSASFALPADWQYQAAGGKILAASPDGSAGFVFTSIQVLPHNYGVQLDQSMMVGQFCAPSQFLPALLSKFGNRNIRILQSQPDVQSMQDFPRYTGRQCQAEDMIVGYVSPRGTPCLAAFKMINAAPSAIGHWFTILTGAWAPEAQFAQYASLLEQIGSSYGINDQYARGYIQQGMANLRVLQQQTARKMQELNQARYENQASWEQGQARKDFMDSRWDDYRRGNSYWVSEMEGGKVYATDPWGTRDTRTGDYYEGGGHTYTHFEGENPRHPSETMREISSYELQQQAN